MAVTPAAPAGRVTRRRGVLALLLALPLVAAGCGPRDPGPSAPGSPFGPALAIRDLDAGGRTARVLPLGPDSTFTLSFTHSMYGGAVQERYRVGQDLVRSTVYAERAGAAEYYALYGNMRRAAEGWWIDVAPLRLSALPVRVDRTGSPSISVGGADLALLDLVPEGHLAELRPAVECP